MEQYLEYARIANAEEKLKEKNRAYCAGVAHFAQHNATPTQAQLRELLK